MPTVSSRRQARTGMISQWQKNTAALNSPPSIPIPCYRCERRRMGSCGFSKRKALGDKEEGDDRGVIERDLHLESEL